MLPGLRGRGALLPGIARSWEALLPARRFSRFPTRRFDTSDAGCTRIPDQLHKLRACAPHARRVAARAPGVRLSPGLRRHHRKPPCGALAVGPDPPALGGHDRPQHLGAETHTNDREGGHPSAQAKGATTARRSGLTKRSPSSCAPSLSGMRLHGSERRIHAPSLPLPGTRLRRLVDDSRNHPHVTKPERPMVQTLLRSARRAFAWNGRRRRVRGAPVPMGGTRTF